MEHNDGHIYRVKPRTNPDVNKWWITDEVRYGWKFVHREDRLAMPLVKGEDVAERTQASAAWAAALERINEQMRSLGTVAHKRLALLVSPMLSCEDAFHLASYALAVDPNALLAVGAIPAHGMDKTFAGGFTLYGEKAPNARGVRRVLEALANGRKIEDFNGFLREVAKPEFGASIITGNYPSEWATPALIEAVRHTFVLLIDTLPSGLTAKADVVLPSVTWTEKAGTFENAKGRLQVFRAAIPSKEFAKSESQIGIELLAEWQVRYPHAFDDAATRAAMARVPGLEMVAQAHLPASEHERVESDMVMVEL